MSMLMQRASERDLDQFVSGNFQPLDSHSTRTLSRALFSGARLSFCLFLLTTSLYCLLAYIPFTYHWVVKGELIAWLPVFVKYHPCFYLAALGLVCPTIARDMQRRETRRLVLSFYVVHIAAGAWMILWPVLPSLENDASSFKWALVSLSPLLWLAAIDFAGHFNRRSWTTEAATRLSHLSLKSAAVPALFLSLLYAIICYLRFRSTLNFTKTELFVIACWTLLSHLLIFLSVFIILNLARILAGRFSAPAKARFFLTGMLSSILGALVMRHLILSAISFDGYMANIYAFAVALVVALLVCGGKLRKKQDVCETEESNPAEEAEQSVAPLSSRSRVLVFLNFSQLKSGFTRTRLLSFAVLIFLAYLVPASVARMDWDFLMQKLSVVAIWTAAFIIWNGTAKAKQPERRRAYPALALVLIAAASFGAYRLMSFSESRLPRLLHNEQLNVGATLEQYATYDISFKVAHDVLSSVFDFSFSKFMRRNMNIVPTASAAPGEGAASEPDEDNGFYGYLKKNTNLMPSVKVDPVEVKLVEDLKPATGDKPNIFIFVVDSLRPDYLSPYNSKVAFTPNIENFAHESVVMQNAFTPYGGTVLAEPSIWTGTMQIHKQFVEPFYPMNALQKLVETDGYQPFITIDPVLKIIVEPSPSIVELDKGIANWQGLDLSNTLKELRAKMDERQDKSRPVFAYTQAQNIHIHKLNRERKMGPPAYEFEGFDSYYSSQLKHIDEGFGEFIQYLKDSNQYDNSIVILTSDHGDSIGEGGRWGHANWIFPEVMKIPIIIHLPTRYQKSLYWNPQSIAFSNDITPSLYYLLGHRPIVRNEIFGKPLFTLTEKEQADYEKRNYMVASSYGPSYGILSDNGHSFFISDATNSKDYFFNLKDDPQGTRNLITADLRARNEKLIRHYVEAINNFYHFNSELSESGGK
jgi:choline-sulfatase